ncbi:heptosyltransferase domain protein [Bacteriovorax sp. BAL6_X]|uniref:glycosyltransferase family 9 protein n=1 Tax=Bacteriovorax sp. BAL6_X TaxID=1201290 RepID=UPI000385FEC1|nr:glycosyltransferase family 9 protein [Bacteriovorax sp. BAL6_X]EPZ50471.1 heptosyltransferase domain protein [Bacteriovorax sp. BAL6_X]
MNALKNEADTKKTIAIIQTTRIGDLLQTSHAVKLLRENHPDYKIILIARKKFATPIMFLLEKVFDEVISIEHKSAMVGVDNVREALTNLKKQLKQINDQNIEVSINLAFSKSATYLHSLIDSKNKVGPHFNELHERVITDRWSQYLYSTVMRGDLNPYNLVDLFSSIIGTTKKLTHLSNKEFSNKKKTNLLIHPFASNERKMWKANRWVEVIYQTLKKDDQVKIYICGANQDQKSTDEILNSELIKPYKERVEAWIGLDLKELYTKVDNSFLFVGHDSMIGNLLSFKNIKTLTISLGTVRPHETTPYALDNYNLAPKTECAPCFPKDECKEYKCHNDVPYNITHQCIGQLLKKNRIDIEELNNSCSSLSLSRVKLYQSDMLDNGDLIINELLHKEQDAKEVMRNFYHIAWTSIFTEVNTSMDIPSFNLQTKAQLSTHIKGIETLYELSEFGKKYSRYIIEEISKNTPSLEEIKKFSAKLDEIDRLSDLVATSYPLLSPVIDFAKVAKNNLQGSNLVNLSEAAFYTYNEISLMCSVLYEFFEKCSLINKAKQEARENI